MTKFAIIDIETTGGTHTSSKITEIAIIIYQNGKIIHEFESLIDPECSIPPEITRITGITNQMVKSAPKFYEIAKQILDLTHDCIFVAHNVNFDYSFVREEYRSLGYSFSRKRLCTIQLSRRYYPGLRSYSLGNLIKHFGIEVKDRHRAMEDAKATLNVFERMLIIESDPTRIQKLIKGMLHSTRLPTHLQISDIDSLPEECGVYYMSDELGRYVYIGKSINIKERILQHFNEYGHKNSKMLRMVHSLAYQLTGSELMACLLESSEIKTHSPEINRAQKNKTEDWAIVKEQNNLGFYYYQIKNLSALKGNEEAIHLFRNSKHANQYLEYLIQEYNLCNSVNQSKISEIKTCNRLQLSFCNGVCNGLESRDDYNKRFMEMHQVVNKFFTKDMFLQDRGRNNLEKSL
ncbi:MAG: exonuclease domain-containing protein, partial [Saprospiraceae bacterium]